MKRQDLIVRYRGIRIAAKYAEGIGWHWVVIPDEKTDKLFWGLCYTAPHWLCEAIDKRAFTWGVKLPDPEAADIAFKTIPF